MDRDWNREQIESQYPAFIRDSDKLVVLNNNTCNARKKGKQYNISFIHRLCTIFFCFVSAACSV